MTRKKIHFKPVAEIRAFVERSSIEKEIDQWVRGSSHTEENTIKAAVTEINEKVEQVEQVEQVKKAKKARKAKKAKQVKSVECFRLSLDIPKRLHKRIKKVCVIEETSMKDKLTELLLNVFSEK
ncbi:MAG: hypothetical protein LBB21_00505 [Holosporaceae bacterium]|jgi:hypothetical protein|nr:hypothetical protein [Holosporaceae bacterium]